MKEAQSNSLFKLGVVKDALGVALDGDLEAGIDELLGRAGRQRRAVFKLFRLAAEPQRLKAISGRSKSGGGGDRARQRGSTDTEAVQCVLTLFCAILSGI